MRTLHLIAAVCGVATVVSGTARAADIHWAAAVSGSFTDGSKWAGGVVPGAGDNAVIDAGGAPYTVNMGGSRTIGGLTLGSADATALVQGSSATGDTTITVSDGLDLSLGTVLLQSADSSFQSNLTVGGAGVVIGAGGTLRTAQGTNGVRTITADIANDGTVDLTFPTALAAGTGINGVHVNRGLFRVRATVTMSGATQVLRQSAGTFDAASALFDVVNAAFAFDGGTVLGQPRIRGAGSLAFGPSSSGAGAFLVGGTSSITGNIAALQSVLVQGSAVNGDSTVVLGGDVDVAGSLTLRSADSSFQTNVNPQGHLLHVLAGGHLSVEQGTNGARNIFGNIENDGTFDVSHPLTLSTAGTVVVNRGVWNVAGGVSVDFSAGGASAAHLDGGALNAAGLLRFDAATVTMTGGTVTGRPVIRGGGALVIDPAATGAASFLLGGSASFGGVIHTGQDVLIQGSSPNGDTTVKASADIVVDGLLTLRSADVSFSSSLNLLGHLLHVEDGGTLSVEQGTNGTRTISGDITNEGTVSITHPLALPLANATYTHNAGSWSVASTLALTGGGERFLLAGGNLAVTGFMNVDGGAFTMTGGSVDTGRPVLRASTLSIAPGAAAAGIARFLLGGASHVTGTIHPLQDVLVQGNGFASDATVVADTDVIVQGLLTMRSADSSFQSSLDFGAAHTLVVDVGGTFSVEQGTNGARTLTGNIQNDGTVNVGFALNLPKGGARYTNTGTWNVNANLAVTGIGESFTLVSGTLSVPSAMNLDNGSFTMTGGAVPVGRPVLRSSTLTLDPSAANTGAAAFLLGSASHIAGTIHPAQDVLIQGNGFAGDSTAVADGDITNLGLLTLRSATSSFASRFNLAGHTLLVGAGGRLSVEQGTNGVREIVGSVTNEGTVDVDFPLALTSGGAVYENRGTWNVRSTLAVTGGAERFTLDDGALAFLGGSMNVNNGTLEMLGGVVTGGAPQARSSNLVIDALAGGAASFLVGGAGSTLAGVIHEGQSVLVQGNGTVGDTTTAAAAPIDVEGTLTLRSADSSFQSRLNLGAQLMTVQPTGVVSIEQGTNGNRDIVGSFDNSGTVNVSFPLGLPVNGATYRTFGAGSVNLTSTLTLNGGAEHFVIEDQAALNVNAGGAYTQSNGSFEMRGGTVAGVGVPQLAGVALSIDVGATGPASFIASSGGSLAGVVHAGQTVVVQGNGFAGDTNLNIADGTLVAGGTVIMRSATSSFQSNIVCQGATGLVIDTGGTLRAEQGTNGTRNVTGNVVNNGRIEADLPMIFQGGVLENADGGEIGGSSTLALSTTAGNFVDAGVFAPGPLPGHGTLTVNRGTTPVPVTGLRVRLGGTAAGQFDVLNLNEPAQLSGPLSIVVDNGYVPVAGDTFVVMNTLGAGNTITGQFNSFAGVDIQRGLQFSVQVNATNVRLTVTKVASFLVTVDPAPNAGVTSGEPFHVVVEARDANDVLEPTFIGSVNLKTDDPFSPDGTIVTAPGVSDGGAGAGPGPFAFAAADNGVHTIDGAVLKRAPGQTTVTVTDTAVPGRKGSVVVDVGAAIRGTAPQLVVNAVGAGGGGVGAGALVNTPVDLDAGITSDDPLVAASTTLTLDGAPLAPGALTTVTAEGTHVVAMSAVDVAGRSATDTFTFTIDTTAPIVSVAAAGDGAVLDGAILAVAVTPTVSVSDLHVDPSPASITATLDGAPYALDGEGTGVTSIGAEGVHTLVVTARDLAGNVGSRTVTFTIDLTPPVITFAGFVPNGGGALAVLNPAAVRPSFVVTDTTQTTVLAALLDGQPFVNGAGTVVGDGAHTLDVTAVDQVGNQAQEVAVFTVDTINPVVTVGGVVDGEQRSGAVTPTVSVSDANPDSAASAVVITVDGAVLASGASVTADGVHSLTATATDRAGHTGSATVGFTIDTTAPVVTFSGFTPVVAGTGAPINPTAVRPAFSVSDLTATTNTPILDGKPLVAGALVGDGVHVFEVVATDALGHSTDASVGFIVDSVAPIVNIVGITDGGRFPAGSSATVSVVEVHPATLVITLDGSTYVEGTPVNAPGNHVLLVHAVDGAGHVTDVSAAFVIDQNVPAIFVSGVDDGVTYSQPVTIEVTSDDPLAVIVVTLDGLPFNGSPVSADGKHALHITATNTQGGVGVRDVRFTIDSTPPDIVLTGVVDGGIYRDPVTPDAVLGSGDIRSVTATLDDVDFVLGTEVSSAGEHVLEVIVTDSAGNEARVQLTFTIDPTAPTLAILGVGDGDIVNHDVTLDVDAALGAGAPGLLASTLVVDGATVTPPFVLDATNGAAAEGRHIVHAEALVDGVVRAVAGLTFTIDTVAPTVTVEGVVDGEVVTGPVTPKFNVADGAGASAGGGGAAGGGGGEFLGAVQSTLDGAPFDSNTDVTAEGVHTLIVDAVDLAGNETVVTVRFTIDTTAPTVTIDFPGEGAVLAPPVTPIATVVDANPGSFVVDVDGVILTASGPGSSVSTGGAHVVHAKAVDLAGNVTEAQVSFTIVSRSPPDIVVTRLGAPAEGDRVVLYAVLSEDGPAGSAGETVRAALDDVGNLTDPNSGGGGGGGGSVTQVAGVVDAQGKAQLPDVPAGRYRARVEHVWQRHFTPAFDMPGGSVIFDVPDEPEYDGVVYVDPRAVGGTADGSESAPFTTIAKALEAPLAFHTIIKVAGGPLSEDVTLPRGVSVRGGHRGGSWVFSPADQVTTITGAVAAGDECELLDVTVKDSPADGVDVTGSALVRDVLVVGAADAGVQASIGAVGTGAQDSFVANVLVDGSGGDGVVTDGRLENVTVVDSASVGINAPSTHASGKRLLSVNNGAADVVDPSGAVAPNTLSDGVVFVSGPLHDRYLAQVRGGQAANSPGVDDGDVTAASLDLRGRTTSAKGSPDVDDADLGYHAWPVVPDEEAPPPPPGAVVPPACGCASGTDAAPVGALFAVLALLGLAKRRRRSEPGRSEGPRRCAPPQHLGSGGDVEPFASGPKGWGGASARRGPAVLVALVVLGLASTLLESCKYQFARTEGVLPGDVTGRALHEDGDGVAAFARISVDGANLVRRTEGDGQFVVRGLTEGAWILHFSEDQNGDGKLDRAGTRAVSLKSFTVPGTTSAQLTSVLLGTIPLGGVVTINGTARRVDGSSTSPSARAFVVRSAADLSPEELAGVAPGSLAGSDGAAEATIGVKEDGSFALADVAPGTFHLVAFDPGDGVRGAAMSVPVAVVAAAGGTADAGELTLAAVTGTRSIGIGVTVDATVAGATGGAAADGASPGVAALGEAPCTVKLVRIGGSPNVAADVVATSAAAVGPRIDVDAPLGAYDVYVDSTGAGADFHGALLGQLAYDGPEVLQWGPVVLSVNDPCHPVGDVDRDHDGKIGLPAKSDAPELYAQCRASCELAGTALADATCDVGGVSYDCDDDGDGEADVLEPNCVGLCFGADLDQDGHCDRDDPEVPVCTPTCGEADAGVVVDAGPTDDAGPGDDGGVAPLRHGCAQAVSLAGDGVVAGTLDALEQGGHDDVDACFDLVSSDAVFKVTLPADGLATMAASTAGSDFDTVLSVYSTSSLTGGDPATCTGGVAGGGGGGTGGANGGAVGCNDDNGGPQSLVTASGVEGGDVYFVLEGYRGAVGDYRLEVTGTYALGAQCDPALTSLVCPGGACGPDGSGGGAGVLRCLPPRDCGDGVDADGDGLPDEDPCVDAPVVTCPGNAVVDVLSPASLSASAVDDVAVASRRWSIVQAPPGSSVALEGAATDNVSFTPVLVGDYVLRYVAGDDAGQLSACEVTVSAKTDDVFRVELLWNVDVTSGDNTDLDLHLLHPTAPDWFDPALDCHFANCRAGSLSWQFGAGPDPSPSLDVDDRDGRGPENINVTSPEDITYRVGVAYFADNGFGPSLATVNVFCFGSLAARIDAPAPLVADAADPEQSSFWKVADVTFDSATSSCTVAPLASIVTTSQARLAR